jgi:alkylation response protein AidB-like acyl-CoA dehydrogenase
MRFSFTADQHLFADGLRELLSRECTAENVRAAWNDGTGHLPQLWQRLADMGVFDLLIPERAGGMGGTEVDAVLLWQELGRAAAPGPVLEHMVAVAPALAGTLAVPAVGTAWFDGPYAPHAEVADAVLTDRGVLTALETSPVDAIDGGRRLAMVTGELTPLDIDADRLRDRLSLATAAFLVGLAEWMIATAADHARHRYQFGKPIGTFQAVKHLLANALLEVEFARAPVYRAAWSMAAGAPTMQRDVSMAKALANEAAYRASRNAMQVHGGMGYTWEADLQLYMKKTWALMRAYGDTRFHRRRVTTRI